MAEKRQYVCPDVMVLAVNADMLTSSGEEFGVMGDYVLDQWEE